MRQHRLPASFALALLFSAVLAPKTPGADWGPSWVGGGPPGGNARPARFDQVETRCAVYDDQSRLGVGVRFWCDGEVVAGHEYELLYQLRVQTKPGEYGALLGNASQPDATTFSLVIATADDKWNGLEETADITRKDLSGMKNLPSGRVSLIRIEPQLFDRTTNKYVTPPKSNAILVQVEVGNNGRVRSVESLSKWIQDNGRYHLDEVLQTLKQADVYDIDGNDLPGALSRMLGQKDLPEDVALKLLAAFPRDWIAGSKTAMATVMELSNSDRPRIASAAKKILSAPSSSTPTRAAPAPGSPAERTAPPASSAPNVSLPPAAPTRPPASPPAVAPPPGSTSVREIDSARLLMASLDGATSAKATLADAARRLATYFDAKPAYLGAYGDDRDQLISTSFKAKLRGVEVRGLIIASIGPKGGCEAIAYDRADARVSSLKALLAGLPHGPVAWHEAVTADGSIRLELPQGWLITSGQQGMCDVAGTEGQFMSLGIHVPITTPDTEQSWLAQRAQVGLPPTPSGLPVSPFCGPVQAVQTVFPMLYKGPSNSGSVKYSIERIVESTETTPPPGLPGKAAIVHYVLDAETNRARIRTHVVANVICMPSPMGGQWVLYYSQAGAPEAIFSRDLPLLLRAWNSYTISGEEIQRRMNEALQNMREAYRMMSESAANARHTVDRCNADFDEVIHGYRTIEDTELGKWSEVDLGWSQKIVEKLNEHAGYERYKEIPLRDQIFSP